MPSSAWREAPARPATVPPGFLQPYGWSFRKPPRPPRRPARPSGSHSAPERDGLALHPNLVETLFDSSFSPAPSAQRSQGLRPQFVCRYHEQRIRYWIRNIDYPQITSPASLPDGNPRTFSAGAIFQGPRQHFLHLVLGNRVSVNVRL